MGLREALTQPRRCWRGRRSAELQVRLTVGSVAAGKPTPALVVFPHLPGPVSTCHAQHPRLCDPRAGTLAERLLGRPVCLGGQERAAPEGWAALTPKARW